MKYKTVILFLAAAFLAVILVPADNIVKPNADSWKDAYIVSDFEVKLATMSRNEIRTRNASVKIYSPEGSSGSGTYFLFKGYHVVFTAAHVVDSGSIFLVTDRWNNERFGSVVYRDSAQDFAIVLIPAFQKTKPIKFKIPQYNIRDKLGEEFYFSGFPAQHNLMTIRGDIAGFQNSHFILHGAAWKGSSGSCVFDKAGRFAGVLVAISVGRLGEDVVLIEDFVWVVPYSEINWIAAELALESAN
jgi:hypothetical protein